jgi:hypothetical protein
VYLIVWPTKIVLGIILFFMTFLIGELLLCQGKDRSFPIGFGSFSSYIHRFLKDILAILVIVFSLLIAYIPAIESKLYVEWVDLTYLNVIRLIAAFFLNFLPGYLIIILAGAKIRGLSKFVASYFLSLFIMTIAGFSGAYVNGRIGSLYLEIFLTVNVFLVIFYFSMRFRKLTFSINQNVSSRRRGSVFSLSHLVLVLSFMFQYAWIWGSLEKVDFFIGGAGSDMWRHHGFAQAFLDGRAFTWIHVPWWFHVYLASFAVLSGVPSVNAYLALYPLVIISKVSFYVMVSSFFKDKRIAVLATLAYITFSGPAWFYALQLRGFGPVTDYDSWIRILWRTGGKFLYQGWYPPFTIAFVASDIAYACLWWLMHAAYSLNLRNKFNFLLVSIVSALSYLLHVSDLLIFTIYLGAFMLIYLYNHYTQSKIKVRLATLSVIASLGIITIIEILLTEYYYFLQYYMTRFESPQYYYFNTPSFYAVLIVSITIIFLSYEELLARRSISRLLSLICKPFVLVSFLSIIYSLSLIVWIIMFPDFDVGLIGVGSVPWYAYLGSGGLPYFLALVSIGYVSLNRKRLHHVMDIITFSVLSLLLLFALGRTVSFVNLNLFYTGFWERRILTYMHPIISMLAAYALVLTFKKINLKSPLDWPKFIISSFLMSVVLLTSVSTTLLALDFTTREDVKSPTTAELDALTYLHYSLPTGFKTAYLNKYTGADYIRSFANDKWTYDSKLWVGQFSSSPEIILAVLDRADVKFLYLHHTRDLKDLEKNVFIQQLIKVLPVEFNNSEVTIYSVPPLHPPTDHATLGIAFPPERSGDSFNAHVVWLLTLAMSNYTYTLMDISNPTTLKSVEIIILPYDPQPYGDDAENLLRWVEEGGYLIISNTNFYGVFSELVGATPKTKLINCDSIENWRTFYGRGEISVETKRKVEGISSIRMKNNKSSWEEWIYTFDEPWNLSEFNYLGIWVYGTGGGPQWYLHLFDSNGRRSSHSFRYDLSVWDYEKRTYIPKFLGWKLHIIPIKKYYGDIDLSSVKELRIVTGFQMPVNFLIDDIFALKGFSLVMASSIKGEETINLSPISVSNINYGSDVKVIASYAQNGEFVAPFAIQKNFGKGKITYLNINTLYQSIFSEKINITVHETLLKILKIIS